MSLDSRARHASLAVRRAVEDMEMSIPTQERSTAERFNRYADRKQRNRRVGALVLAGVLTVIIAVVAVRTIGTGTEPQPVDKITPEEAAAILDAVTLAEADEPTGTGYLTTVSGVDALGRPFPDEIARPWAKDGFVDAKLVAFNSDDGLGFIGSWAVVYEDEAIAARQFARYEELFTAEPRYGFGFSQAEVAELGDEGWSFTDPDGTSEECTPAAATLWRVGPVILHVLACSSPETDEIQGVVDQMVAQAEVADLPN